MCETAKNEEFLLANDRVSNITIFCCETNIRYLCKQTTIYVDGTFSCYPKYFCQFFTIHSIENGHYIPLIFSLHPDKTSGSYEAVFEIIRKKCRQLPLEFSPKRVIGDFKVTVHTGLNKICPKIELVGCRFPLAQSWWRKVQEIRAHQGQK